MIFRLDPPVVGTSSLIVSMNQEVQVVELKVDEMTCGHCVRAVTEAVKTVDAEAQVQVDLASKRVRVEGRSSADELIRVLGEAGYPALKALG